MAGKPQSQVGRVCNGKRIAKTRPGMMPGPAKVGEVIDCLNALLNIRILLTDGDEAKATISDGGLVLQIPNTASSAPGTGATVNWRGLYNDEETYALADAVYTEPDSSTRILWVCETVNGPGSPQLPTWPEPGGTIYWRCYARVESSAGSSTRYRVKSVQGDYLTCRTWDGSTEGNSDVFIAKPPQLRHSISSQSINGVTVSFTGYGVSAGICTRSASASGYPTQSEMVLPVYQIAGSGQDAEIWADEPSGGTGVEKGSSALTKQDTNRDARAWCQVG